MSERIQKRRVQSRLDELRRVEQETVTRLMAIRTAIAELEALLQPEHTGEQLGEQEP